MGCLELVSLNLFFLCRLLAQTGLDVDVRRRVWEAIGRARRGRCILMSTHSLEEADELATRIGILAHGKLKVC